MRLFTPVTLIKMTKEQEKSAQKFFAMLASHGIKKFLCITPPEGGDVAAKIEQDGSLTMIDKRDGQQKKIKPN